jgi:hypothetical protein
MASKFSERKIYLSHHNTKGGKIYSWKASRLNCISFDFKNQGKMGRKAFSKNFYFLHIETLTISHLLITWLGLHTRALAESKVASSNKFEVNGTPEERPLRVDRFPIFILRRFGTAKRSEVHSLMANPSGITF